MEERDEEKKARLLGALDQGLVMIHLDARRPGVDVPPSLRHEAHLRLNLSYKFDPPDLSVTSWGIRATLSFSGRRYPVAVPWSSLFALTSHVSREFWMYPDDMPEELLQSPPAEPPPAGPPPRRVTLQQVQGGRDDALGAPSGEDSSSDGAGEPAKDVPPSVEARAESGPPQPPASEDGPDKPRARAHLRLVK